MRSITAPFLVAPSAGARVKTRLRPSQQDAVVLHLVGECLGRLASGDLARRCKAGPGIDGRTGRKRALTAASSSRWRERSPAPATTNGNGPIATCWTSALACDGRSG
jgi:hypothetical protein